MVRVSTLHVHRFGPPDAPVVLALHGLTGHGARWAALAEEHLPDVRIIAPDLRGHGRSTALPPWDFETVVADLAELLRAETDGPVLVAGHSFGGATGVHLAARHPDLVRALVLLDPAIAIQPDRLADIAQRTLDEPDYPDVAAARRDKLASAWHDVAPRLLDAELDEHLVPTRPGRVGWRLSLPAVTSYWGQLARPFVLPPAGLPTVLVQAMLVQPPFVTPAFRAALAERLGPALTIHEFDCDHMVPLARPAETAALIRGLL
ncbi:alpha/beta fold hydrolase [Nocardia farcinica]|uniref:Putative hydrolase n=1 Tax=Nocardia farcinica (strain IFM 10152) TaxID=247156 RepID=Q5YR00_NOCFA|nr:alpha/beta fold hydrolase [Nocardia farcinica]AXK88120.1 alpha/beta hydrolase [Nocardia farcinica]MBF6141771.1 alpha/beta fold hydrolase [Nocardia farcinica]MBF6265191.1 alpha/beta fold hydrolase [Nocardia farcinica]MBF6269843.1 alpha/beta fold hydrolase [Nocardia farcinica]MBF6283808.1 alpha/beta fold hydrolase [Nocardia farcinica]